MLDLPDFSKPFFVSTDASDEGYGACLQQKDSNGWLRPIEFISKKFQGKEKSMSTYEKELAAVGSAIQKWRQYFEGNHFKIMTDHISLMNFMTQQTKLTIRMTHP